MKYIYSISQMSKLSLILYTFSITGSVASLFLTKVYKTDDNLGFSYHVLCPTIYYVVVT